MHKEEQTITEVTVENLVSEVSKMYDEGYRLVQIGCGKYGDPFIINSEKTHCNYNSGKK